MKNYILSQYLNSVEKFIEFKVIQYLNIYVNRYNNNTVIFVLCFYLYQVLVFKL
jgi:hypothetical protein